MFVLEPRLRRVVYVIAFEILAIALSTALLTVLSGGHADDSLPVAVAVSAIAVIWNYVFNTAFEACERRLGIAGRTIGVRVAHTAGFEFGLFLFTVPLYMAWYHVGLVEAFRMEMAILVFFLVYTFVFTWAFDTLFALPRHSGARRPAGAEPSTDG